MHLFFLFPFHSWVATVAASPFLSIALAARFTMARRPSLDSTQSFELVSPPSGGRISQFSSDDDEIVWSVSSLSLSDRAFCSPRSEDYMILSPPSVVSSYVTDLQPFIEDDLISNPPILSQPPTPQPFSPSRRSRRRRNCQVHVQQQSARGKAPPQTTPSKPSEGKAAASSQSPKRRRKRPEKRNDPSPPRGKCQSFILAPPAPGSLTKGLGARSVVDDVSERDNDSVYGDGTSESSSAVYDKAVHYINWCAVSPYAAQI